MKRLICYLALVAMLLCPSTVDAQEFNEGELIEATRNFEWAQEDKEGTIAFRFLVAYFTDENATRVALDEWVDEILSFDLTDDETFRAIEQVSGPLKYDESLWFVAHGTPETDDFTGVMLVFKYRNSLSAWFAVGKEGDVYSDLEYVADNFALTVPVEVNEVTVLSMLPDLENLPFGYTLEEEEVATNESLATPSAP